MRKIWRKDKHKNSNDPNTVSTSSHNNRNSVLFFPTIDENSSTGDQRTVVSHRDSIDVSKVMLSRSETLTSSISSSLQGVRSVRPSRSTLSKSSKTSMNSLVKSEWDLKIIKTGWMNRGSSEFGDDSLKLFRVELKGTHLYLYKAPADLYNVKSFRIASESEEDDEESEDLLDLEDYNLLKRQSITDLAPPKSTSDQSFISSSPTLTQDLNSLRKPSLMTHQDLNGSFDDSFNLNRSSEDVTSMRSKTSYPMLSNLSNSDVSQYSLSFSPVKSHSNQLLLTPLVKLVYYSLKYPHPNLVIDQHTQAIISGDIESICHAILFNTFVQNDGDNNKATKHLLSLLPLMEDITTCLLYFKKYSDIFISTALSLDHKENFEEQLVIPRKTELIMTQRLKLIVEYLKDNFSGMLLEDSIFKAVWELLSSISAHEDVTVLQKLIHNKQQELFELFHQVEDIDYNTIVNEELLTANFLKMDLSEVATEINNINLSFSRMWNPQADCSLLFQNNQDNYSYYRRNPLVFDSHRNIHYLGRLLINQLFLDPVYSKKPSKRAKVIKRWVELGSHFDKIGDMVGWLAIATVICSVPVLRLKKTWDYIELDVIHTVSMDWAPVVFELDRRSMVSDSSHRSSYHVIAPQGIGEIYPKENVIPYFGDLYVKKPDVATIKQCERKVQRVIVSLNRWQEYVDKVKNSSSVLTQHKRPSNQHISTLLYGLLNYHISCPVLTLDSIMKVSLDIEPSTNGTFYQFHNSSRSPLFLGSYPSVIFPEVLPKYKVYDQKVLIGAIGNESTSKHVYDNTKSNQFNVVNSVALDSNGASTGLQFHEQRPGRNQFLKNLRDIFNIESWDLRVSDSIIFKAMIPDQESELITEVPYEQQEIDHDSETPNTSKPRSRPSSVLFNESANTKRYSNYSTNLNDFQKQVGKVKDEEHIYEMFTKLATLERLIDLLVLTSNIFVSEIDKDDVENYFSDVSTKLKNYTFKMDNGVYTVTFFATYRSFCSTSDLLKGLLKRFVGARSAAVSIYDRREKLAHSGQASLKIDDEYPSWSEEVNDSHPDYDKIVWNYVAQIQIGILEALVALVKDHYDHFIDDLSVRDTFIDILKVIDNEVIIEWTAVISDVELHAKIDDLLRKQFIELQSHYDQILNLYKKLRKSYIKRSYKPSTSDYKAPNFSSTLATIPLENTLPASSNTAKIEDFINEFDELVSILFSRISVDDLFNVFEIIEIQASQTTGLFNYLMQKLNTPDDELVISDIFSWFATLNDTSESGVTKGYAVNKFPATVRSIIQLYYKLRTYLVSQITDPFISQDLRVDRMKSIIIMLDMSRFKMKGVDLFNFALLENCQVSPHVPSLIETALINSIVSPESRLFADSWIMASNAFNSNEQTNTFDTLESLLPTTLCFDETHLKNNKTLTPCIGWLSERLVEIACYIPNMSVSNTKLINFDKRRYAYNCISNILDMKEVYEGEAVTNIENFRFLFKLRDDELFDIEDVKKVALTENQSGQNLVLFQKHLDEERNILRKEHAKKAFLTKQKQERKNAEMREAAALRVKQLNPSSNAHSLAKMRQSFIESPLNKSRFKFSIFNKQARPFSFSGSGNPERVVRNIDLPDANIYLDPKQKAATVINLKDMSIFPIYRVPALFKIGNSNDTEYFLQALTDLDKEEWIYQLNYSRRHWFYSKPLNRNISSNLIFGVPIDFICQRESSLIPHIIDKLMTEIEVRGLEEVGIYRKSASLSVLHLLKNEIDKTGDFNMENHLIFDINNATGCIKMFLRDIPDSLIPDELIPEFGEVREEGLQFEDRLNIYKTVLPKVPYHNYHLLKRLIRHLKVVDEFSEFNKMTASNLSTIIGATFTEGASPELTKKYFGLMNFICEDMIRHYDLVFENDEQLV